MLVKPVKRDIGLEEAARSIGEDYDIVLAEGFKQSAVPKIEVHRQQAGPPLSGVRKLIAIVTDETLETRVRQFSLTDVTGVADLLERGFIQPKQERITLYVNDVPVTLTAFPREIITNMVLAMASSLKGVEEVRRVDLFLRKENSPARDG